MGGSLGGFGTDQGAGEVAEDHFQEEMLLEDGYVQLDKGEVVTVNGIDGYALPQLLARFSYARPKE